MREVYKLLEYLLKKIGPIPILLERDNNISPYREAEGGITQVRSSAGWNEYDMMRRYFRGKGIAYCGY
ncbi:MAG: hypothetical protein Q9N34_02100 [Aquificota bacterium]|nr:hypothetical protein [Aquificota bacterium]